MNANELFNDFIKYCKSYEIVLGNIVIKNNEDMFILLKPANLSCDYLIYVITKDGRRENGSCSDIEELVELATYAVGDMIKTENKNPYFLKKSPKGGQCCGC